MKFIEKKTEGGRIKGKKSFYCKMLNISREGFRKYEKNRNRAWKYQALADEMKQIVREDECNDTYGRQRMYQALKLREPGRRDIPSERTVYRIMQKTGLVHRPLRKAKGITKADRNARKSEDLLKRDFSSERPFAKTVTDITEIKCRNGKVYVSAIFDCYDLSVLGLSMDTNMKSLLCVQTVSNAMKSYPELKGGIIHSDRGSQYTSEVYRKALSSYGIVQSMNSDGGRCHDNARCESMWSRMKTELLYGRYKTEKMTVSQVKALVWRYFMSYWNNRRICSANGGVPPVIKRQRYFAKFGQVA